MTDVTGEAPHLMTNVNRRTVAHEVTYAGARFLCAFAPLYGPFTGCLLGFTGFRGVFRRFCRFFCRHLDDFRSIFDRKWTDFGTVQSPVSEGEPCLWPPRFEPPERRYFRRWKTKPAP